MRIWRHYFTEIINKTRQWRTRTGNNWLLWTRTRNRGTNTFRSTHYNLV